MNNQLLTKTQESLERFTHWLDGYGPASFDHQSFFAGPFGGRAKALYYRNGAVGTLAVSPMIFCEAFFPPGRKFFWQPQRFAIADAHYAMGFAFLYQVSADRRHYQKALDFLTALAESRCPGYEHFCWGYPFDWVTRNGVIPTGTPLITVTPYAYEAFAEVYKIDVGGRWLAIMHSIAEHAAKDIKDFAAGPNASTCSYTPFDSGGVINASAYRACLLTKASIDCGKPKYWQIAERNLNFVLQAQQPNGSWYYAVDGVRDFVDHFHTCFVLKALAKIEQLTGHQGCRQAIHKGLKYYLANLFDQHGHPKPFAKAPRLTVYRNEFYDYAECINLLVLLGSQYPELDTVLTRVLTDTFDHWQKADGSFRSRKLLLGWDNVPMHRWAQSQMFRSLAFLVHQCLSNPPQRRRERRDNENQ
jgi:hypothetical protein